VLRNNFKTAIYGLAFVLQSCTSISPLIKDSSEITKDALNNIKIKADVYYEYKIRGILSNMLNRYSKELSIYKINIEIAEENNTAAYSEKKVIKEQTRIIGKIEIFDENYNNVLCKSIDSTATFEIDDNVPLANMFSKKQSIDNTISDIANNIALIIIDFIF
jgi:hypothetical protein